MGRFVPSLNSFRLNFQKNDCNKKFSAKAPGRPIFDEMLRRIERREAEGIIAWHPDRLARNSVDGGRIMMHVKGLERLCH